MQKKKKKKKNSMRLLFIKLEKPQFGTILGLFGPKNPRTRSFSKNRAPSLFNLHETHAFIQAFLSTAVFPQRFSLFTVCLI